MGGTRIAVYIIVILVIILSLLVSMLNLERDQEFVIAKWAICGILATVAGGVSLLELRFLSKRDRFCMSVLLFVKMFAIPLTVIALGAIVLVLMQRDDLLEKLFLQAPWMPVFFVFLPSMGIHLLYVYVSKRRMG